MTEQKYVKCKICKVETENLEKGLCPVCREKEILHESIAQKLRTHLQDTEPQKNAINIIIFIVHSEPETSSFPLNSCFNLSYLHKFKSEHLTRIKHGRKWGKSNYKYNKYNSGFALVIIYIAVTHTFPTLLDLKGGLFF